MKQIITLLSLLVLIFTVGVNAQTKPSKITSTYDVTFDIGTGGKMFSNGLPMTNVSKISANLNDIITFNITPDTGYELSTLTLNNSNIKDLVANNQFNTPAISANSIIKATFILKQYRLSVRTGDGAVFILMCDYNTTPSFDVSPPTGKTLASVLYNNTNITNQVVNGICTVPGVITNSTLVVTYGEDNATSISSKNTLTEKVYGQNSNIVIENSSNGDFINIYSMLGKQIKTIQSNGSKIFLNLQSGSVYIVKTKNKTYKVIL